MTAARSTAGLRKASTKSRNDARRKIKKALREMQRAVASTKVVYESDLISGTGVS